MKKCNYSLWSFLILLCAYALLPNLGMAQDKAGSGSTLERPLLQGEGSAQTKLDLSQSNQFLKVQNLDVRAKGALLQDVKQKGSFTTKAIKIELDNPVTIISAHMALNGENLHPNSIDIEIRSSLDGSKWNAWEFVELNGEDQEVDTRLGSVPFDLTKETRYVQYRVSWTADPKNQASVDNVDVYFYTPGETPKLNIKKAQQEMINYMQSGGCSKPPISSRNSWGARPGSKFPTFDNNPTHIIVHHSGSFRTDPIQDLKIIQNWHKDNNGWADIGYNYLIDRFGVIYQGRPEGERGAHVCGLNRNTIGICMLGSFENQKPTAAALASLDKLLAWKAKQKNIDPTGSSYHYSVGGNLKNIAAHRNVCTTTCPGDAFYATYPNLRTRVKNLIQNGCSGGDVSDTENPTTSITAPNAVSNDFTATFTDADNVGVTGRFYQVLENQTGQTRANRGNGFFNDNFSTGSLHSDYTIGVGAWSANGDGRLHQTDVASTNTALSTFLSQTNGNSYLYNFAARLNSTSGNRRFGLHIMASSNTSERGNNYLIWFAEDLGKVYIFETINNVLNSRANANLAVGTSWADYKITYATTSGKIEVFRNDQLLVQWTDSSPLTSGNHISLRTNEANVEFDDLKVYKSRSTSSAISVGSENSKDLRTNLAATGQVKSIVRDAAGNWSAVGNANVTMSGGSNSVTDIAGNWAENEIRYLLDNDYLSGYSDNTFRPDNQLTRAELAVMIVACIDPQPIRPAIQFSDISSSDWFASAVEQAYRGGYLSGYPDGTFKPNDLATRLQVTVAVSSGLNLSGGDPAFLNLFTDKGDIPSWATASVSHAIFKRFVANHPDKSFYRPNEVSTRANAAFVMYRALRYLNKAPDLWNSYMVLPPSTASRVGTSVVEADELSDQIDLYPNPIEGGRLNIDYVLTGDSPVSIKLYNLLGDEVAVLYQGEKQAGKQHEALDISDLKLKAGTYLIKIDSKDGKKTIRLVKI